MKLIYGVYLVVGVIAVALLLRTYYGFVQTGIDRSTFAPLLADSGRSGFADVAVDPDDLNVVRIKRLGGADTLPHADAIAATACTLSPRPVRVRVYAPAINDFATATQPPEYEKACQ